MRVMKYGLKVDFQVSFTHDCWRSGRYTTRDVGGSPDGVVGKITDVHEYRSVVVRSSGVCPFLAARQGHYPHVPGPIVKTTKVTGIS